MIEWVVLFFLILASILDFKFREIPAVALTGLAFVVLLSNPQNLIYGILAIGLFLIYEEMGTPIGMADYKLIFVIGLLITTMQNFVILTVGLLFGMLFYAFFMVKFSKFEEGDYPLIPMLLGIYIALMLGGVI